MPGMRSGWRRQTPALPSTRARSSGACLIAGERIALMDETGLDVQVLSLTTPALHDLIAKSDGLSAKEGQSIARAIGMFGWKRMRSS